MREATIHMLFTNYIIKFINKVNKLLFIAYL